MVKRLRRKGMWIRWTKWAWWTGQQPAARLLCAYHPAPACIRVSVQCRHFSAGTCPSPLASIAADYGGNHSFFRL